MPSTTTVRRTISNQTSLIIPIDRGWAEENGTRRTLAHVGRLSDVLLKHDRGGREQTRVVIRDDLRMRVRIDEKNE